MSARWPMGGREVKMVTILWAPRNKGPESLKGHAELGRVAGSWSSGYDIALTWRRSPVRIRSSPLLSMQVNFLSEPIVPPACVSRPGSGPSAFPRGCGIIGCPAATHRGERLSMRAEIRDADEAPELEGVGSSRVHRRRRRIGGPRLASPPKPPPPRVFRGLLPGRPPFSRRD